jgi:uncharacterized iron-regulated protein
MSYEVVEVVGLPVVEEILVYVKRDGTEIKDEVATGETIRKEPGDTITLRELKKAGQTEDDIAALVESGAIKEKT